MRAILMVLFTAIAVNGGKITSDTLVATKLLRADTAFVRALKASGVITGNVTGNLTGNVTGNVSGNLTGNVTGSISGGTVAGSTGTFTDVMNTDSIYSTKTMSGGGLTTRNGNITTGTGDITTDSIYSRTSKSLGYSGPLIGNVTGNVSGNLTGNVTGTADSAKVAGRLNGNVVSDSIYSRTITTSGSAQVNGESISIGGNSNNGLLNTKYSLRINIDSDNNSTSEVFQIGKNQTAIDNNNELFRVQENGRVGIGTINPEYLLHIKDGTVPDIALEPTTGKKWLFGPGAGDLSTYNDFGFYNVTDAVHSFTLKANGYVGIGTTAPANKFHVAGGGIKLSTSNADGFEDRAYIYSGGGGDDATFTLYNNSQTAKVLFNTNGNSYLTGGNVGIGTTSPTKKLEVSGSVKCDTLISDSIYTRTIRTSGKIGIGKSPNNALDLQDNTEGYPAVVFKQVCPTSGANKGLYCKGGSNNQDYSAMFVSHSDDTILHLGGDGTVKVHTKLQLPRSNESMDTANYFKIDTTLSLLLSHNGLNIKADAGLGGFVKTLKIEPYTITAPIAAIEDQLSFGVNNSNNSWQLVKTADSLVWWYKNNSGDLVSRGRVYGTYVLEGAMPEYNKNFYIPIPRSKIVNMSGVGKRYDMLIPAGMPLGTTVQWYFYAFSSGDSVTVYNNGSMNADSTFTIKIEYKQ